MRVFLWYPQGRLGNLIFQFQAVSRISGTSRVIAPDSEFFDLFEKPSRFIVLGCFRKFRWRLQEMWTRMLQRLAMAEWIGTIEPGRHVILDDHTGDSPDLLWQPGRLGSVFMVRGYFHTPDYVTPMPRIKQEKLSDAENRLRDIPKARRVAVHMRFGDYLQWPVFGVPGLACLPQTYYRDAIKLVLARVPDAHFIIFSDEPERAKTMLDSLDAAGRTSIADGGTPLLDFALMACCSHAIVSASTFSWWAAVLIDNPRRVLVAPKYWAGFRRKTWYPSGIRSEEFTYVDPVADEAVVHEH